MKQGECSDIEYCLLKWFRQCFAKKFLMNRPILREEAE